MISCPLKISFQRRLWLGSLLLFFLFSKQSYGQTPRWYEHYSFLNGGFNRDNFRNCDKLIRLCPLGEGSIFPQDSCVTQTLNKNRVCKQTNQLLNTLDFYYNGLIIHDAGKYTVAETLSGADAQSVDYIISPAGYLVKATINPLEFNSLMQNKHPAGLDVITNYKSPSFVHAQHGKLIFYSLISARECVACETALCAQAQFIKSDAVA